MAQITRTDAHDGWDPAIYQDMIDNAQNGCVGTTLVSETDKLRVWHLHLQPGQRCAFHRHVNPYFWTAMTAGRARAYSSDGEIVEMAYTPGQTQHYHYGPGEYLLHSLENISDTELVFVTVEHLDHPGEPLPIPESLRA